MNEETILTEVNGIKIEVIRELFDLFMEAGYNLRDEESFKLIKLNYFKKKWLGWNKMKKLKFDYEYVDNVLVLIQHIRNCENNSKKHKQQVTYSTYHEAMTQVCFTCKKVRSMMNKKWLGDEKWQVQKKE